MTKIPVKVPAKYNDMFSSISDGILECQEILQSYDGMVLLLSLLTSEHNRFTFRHRDGDHSNYKIIEPWFLAYLNETRYISSINEFISLDKKLVDDGGNEFKKYFDRYIENLFEQRFGQGRIYPYNSVEYRDFEISKDNQCNLKSLAESYLKSINVIASVVKDNSNNIMNSLNREMFITVLQVYTQKSSNGKLLFNGDDIENGDYFEKDVVKTYKIFVDKFVQLYKDIEYLNKFNIDWKIFKNASNDTIKTILSSMPEDIARQDQICKIGKTIGRVKFFADIKGMVYEVDSNFSKNTISRKMLFLLYKNKNG